MVRARFRRIAVVLAVGLALPALWAAVNSDPGTPLTPVALRSVATAPGTKPAVRRGTVHAAVPFGARTDAARTLGVLTAVLLAWLASRTWTGATTFATGRPELARRRYCISLRAPPPVLA